MTTDKEAYILEVSGAHSLTKIEDLQTLWSGYGVISRYRLHGGEHSHLILKHVQLPDKTHHPRGWNTDLSHQRKIRSYHVECAWYAQYSQLCDSNCRVPRCLGTYETDTEFLILMEDLSENGYPLVKDQLRLEEIFVCLSWLANFHARFMHQEPCSLWEKGTYWHLQTRPDELAALDDLALRHAAPDLDRALSSSAFQTLVHGDAKLANFCFAENGQQVAAVDFQYVGGGCGMKDVAYFIGSCLDESECEAHEQILLNTYFSELHKALERYQAGINPAQVEAAWRPLYKIAWADFHRFLKGWSPGHWKIHSYSERMSQQALEQLNLSLGQS